MTVDTTTISPSGQIYIPKSMRKKLRLKTGERFVVVGEGDSIVFMVVTSLDFTPKDRSLPIATLSPNGQVVIPKLIRQELCLKTGDRFVEVGERDSIILKALAIPSLDLVDRLLGAASKHAKRVLEGA